MQVITGKYRARKLVGVDGTETRPTLARVKESIFNLIQGKVESAVVLDLFAGSGAFGIECISRGAKQVFFVDESKAAINAINTNTRNISEDFEILNLDYKAALLKFAQKSIQFDLVFLDPPYKSGFAIDALKLLFTNNLLRDGATVVVEHEFENDLQNVDSCYIMEKSRKYGIAYVDIFTYKS